jgi:hypothetical protein
MITASILEGILSSVYISLMYFMAAGFKDSNDYMNYTLSQFCLLLSLSNGASSFFSISVDFLMYPMFIQAFLYFLNQYRLKHKSSLKRGDTSDQLSLPLNIRLKISLVLFLFSINVIHSIYTHLMRIWQTVDPVMFIEITNNKSEKYELYKIKEEFALNFKDICMGTAFTYLAYHLTLS